MRFLSVASTLVAENEQARAFFNMVFGEDPYWDSVDHYIETHQSGGDKIPEIYMHEARNLFDKDEFAKADHFVQRALGYNRPEMSPSDDLNASLKKTRQLLETARLKTAYRNASQAYSAYWDEQELENINEIHQQWSKSPYWRQTWALVAELVQSMSSETIGVFEPGGFAGLNLAMIRDQLPESVRLRTRFSGADPCRDAVTFANKNYPDFQFDSGSLEDIYKEKITLPEPLNICLVSSVFIILEPRTVKNFLKFMSKRTEHLFICDDIMNVNGPFSLLRAPMNTFIHNFRGLLEESGFKVKQVILAEQTDRDRNGFIVASSVRDGS